MNHYEDIKDQPGDIEAMLPWYVAGTLDDGEVRLLEAELESNRELRHQLELIREELGYNVDMNEALGAPSPDALAKLMAGIAAEERQAPIAARMRGAVSGWLERMGASFSPMGIGISAVAAVLVICVQGVLLAGLYRQGMAPEAVYQTASGKTAEQKHGGTMALISFAPGASVDDITGFLLENDLQITAGPRPGGIYAVLVDKKQLDESTLSRRLDDLRSNTAIISFLAPLK